MTTQSNAHQAPVRIAMTNKVVESIYPTCYLYKKKGVWKIEASSGDRLAFSLFFKNPLVMSFRLEDAPENITADDVLDLCRADAFDFVACRIFSGPRRPASDPYETAARAAGWDLRYDEKDRPYFIIVSEPDVGHVSDSDVDNGDWRTLCERHQIVPVIDSGKGSLVTEMYAALKKAEPVCDDAYHDAQLELDATEGRNEHDRRVLTQNRDAAKGALDAVRAALARAEGQA